MPKRVEMCNRQKQTTMNRIRNILLAAASVVCLATSAQKSITTKLCWIDGDISSAQSATASFDISGLHPGVHSYHIRVQDNEGMWSPVMTKFFIISHARDEEPASSITTREYWLDGRFANRITINQSQAVIDIGTLAAGVHSFTMRVRDDLGKWSPLVTQYFIIPHEPDSEEVIDQCRYWFDDKEQNANVVALEEVPGVIQLNIVNLSHGVHTLNWQVRDSKRAWSKVYTETFNISEYFPGDVNCDGKFDVEDVNAIINIILELKSPSDYPGIPDITDDGKVDVEDVNAVINIILMD